jgi:histidine ammonia-lyase
LRKLAIELLTAAQALDFRTTTTTLEPLGKKSLLNLGKYEIQ